MAFKVPTPPTRSTDPPAGEHTSIWVESVPDHDFSSLTGPIEVDTAVIGGGIVGITTAFNLVEAGQHVAVLERDHILNGVTGHTTAKLTSLHGLIYDYLTSEFGESKAQQYADANEAAIDEIDSRIGSLNIDCNFQRAPAITYTTTERKTRDIHEEVHAAKRLGLPVSFTDSTPLPLELKGAVQFDNQAYFHPRKYLFALAEDITENGSHVFEQTRATDVTDGNPCQVSTDVGDVTAEHVIIASHFPIYDHAFYYARLYPKRSYVLAARLNSSNPDAMYYRTGDPYFSIRPRPTGDDSTVLIGGQNHRTAHGGSTATRYQRLEEEARATFDIDAIEYRWSTQDYVSVDRVPFIGKHSPGTESIFIASGFGGWGMTAGTAAGRILADAVLDQDNPWSAVYDPARLEISASARPLIKHNTDAMRHYLVDRFKTPPTINITELDRGEAKIIEWDDDPVGVYRDNEGSIHTVSANCTHMGCLLEWNDGEQSWDCPCHGSRFTHDGSVIDTPAVDNLERYPTVGESPTEGESE